MTVSLTHPVHTAHVVSHVMTNVTHALITQTQIDNGVMQQFQAIEAALKWVGDRQQALVGRQLLQCDWQRDIMCNSITL